jgi:hypothetical protein
MLAAVAFGYAGLKLSALPRLFLGYTVATVVVVALVLMFFTHPMGDDFCNAVNVREHGVLGAVWNEYMHWGGRWGAHLLTVAFPALFELERWYPLGLLSIWVISIAALRFLLQSVLPLGEDRRLSWALTFAFFALYWTGMPHPGQTLYWLEGAWIYSLNLSLSLVIVGCLLRLPRKPWPRHALVWFGLGGLAFWVAAFHELFGLALLGVLLAGLALALRARDPRAGAWGVVAVGTLLGVATVLLAPGNEARLDTAPKALSVVGALKATFRMWFRVLDTPVRLDPVGTNIPLGWVVDPRLMAASVLFATARPIRGLRSAWLEREPLLWKIGVPLAALALLTGSFAAGGWALGRTLPLRAFNSLYLIFLLGWFLALFVHTREGDERLDHEPTVNLLKVLSIVVLALGLIFSTNFKHAMRDLGKGSTRSFDREMSRRYEEARRLRAAGGGELVVRRVEPWPSSYFRNDVDELAPPLRQCVARYLGVDSVRSDGIARR